MGYLGSLFTKATGKPSLHDIFHPHYALLPALESYPSALKALRHSSHAFTSWSAFKHLYLTTDPVHSAVHFSLAMSVIVWILGELTGNVSQVDRLWTFLPIAYSTHWTWFPGGVNGNGASEGTREGKERLVLMWGLQLLWSARLTTNTYRRGFFNPKSEDYRWEIVRANIPVWAFKILNLTFIAFGQNILLAISSLPTYLISTLPASRSPGLNAADYFLAAAFVATLATEMLADNQQQAYQHEKKRLKAQGKETGDTRRGFVTNGLWSWSRHPNFACEQLTWYILYLFTVLPFLPSPIPTTSSISTFLQHPDALLSHAKHYITKELAAIPADVWMNYSIASPLTMTALFYSSTMLTEIISSGKYPLYKQYQQRVGMFSPLDTVSKGLRLSIWRQKRAIDEVVFGGARGVVGGSVGGGGGSVKSGGAGKKVKKN